MNKKGLSSVVTTVLLILVAIAVVVIISMLILGFGRQGSKQAEIKSKSITIIGQLEADVISYNPGKNVSLRLKRTAGIENITGVLFVLNDENGKSYGYNESVFLEEFGIKAFFIDFSAQNLAELDSIEIAPIFVISSGESVVSAVSQQIQRQRISGGGGSGESGSGGDGGGGSDGGNNDVQPAEISVNPAVSNVNMNDNVLVKININNVVDLYGLQFDFRYDKDVLQYVTAREGEFLKQNGGQTYYFAPNSDIPGLLKNFVIAKGYVQVGVSGNGELAELEFKAIGAGTSKIEIEKGLGGIFNSSFDELSYTHLNGTINVN